MKRFAFFSSLSKLGLDEGKPVRRGQVLVELDTAVLNSELMQAKAELGLASNTFERTRLLAQRGTATQVAFEQANAELLVLSEGAY